MLFVIFTEAYSYCTQMQTEDRQLFAAKKYCSDNNDDEDEDEAQNIEWLQEEMKRVMTANNIAEAFTHDTVQKGISAHGTLHSSR
jgi:hypothetical protein